MVVKQFAQRAAHPRIRGNLVAGLLVGVADRLRAERVRLCRQIRVTEQHADALVERHQFLVAEAPQLGRELPEAQRFLEVVVGHERERSFQLGELLRGLARDLAAGAELFQIELLEFGLELAALGTEYLAGFLIGGLRVAIAALGDQRDQHLVGLVEHSGGRGAKLRANEVAAFPEKLLEWSRLLRRFRHPRSPERQARP